MLAVHGAGHELHVGYLGDSRGDSGLGLGLQQALQRDRQPRPLLPRLLALETVRGYVLLSGEGGGGMQCTLKGWLGLGMRHTLSISCASVCRFVTWINRWEARTPITEQFAVCAMLNARIDFEKRGIIPIKH